MTGIEKLAAIGEILVAVLGMVAICAFAFNGRPWTAFVCFLMTLYVVGAGVRIRDLPDGADADGDELPKVS